MTTPDQHRQAMGAEADLDRCPLMPTYPAPAVQFIRGEGSWLWDREDTKYLDLLSGLAVTSLGHSHPAVAEALAEQARRLVHVSNMFGTEHNAVVASMLDGLLGGGGQVFFSNSGAEANEAALKLARKFGGRGRHVVVSAYGSFHGRTLATLHATGQPSKHEAFQPLPEGFRHVAWCDIDQLDSALDGTVAAVLLEPVQGEGGVQPADAQYLHDVRRLCDERGALLMFDEVQTGLGRCGAWFAHQIYEVRPDVVTMAKALGNGVPIGACWARTEVAAAFEPGDHATTYGGQPLATAAARAVLSVMIDQEVPTRARRAGERFRTRLAELDGVHSVRGLGLLLAVELDTGSLGAGSAEVNAELLARGVIANAVTPTALRLAPSLLIGDDEIDLAVSTMADALAAVAERSNAPEAAR